MAQKTGGRIDEHVLCLMYMRLLHYSFLHGRTLDIFD